MNLLDCPRQINSNHKKKCSADIRVFEADSNMTCNGCTLEKAIANASPSKAGPKRVRPDIVITFSNFAWSG